MCFTDNFILSQMKYCFSNVRHCPFRLYIEPLKYCQCLFPVGTVLFAIFYFFLKTTPHFHRIQTVCIYLYIVLYTVGLIHANFRRLSIKRIKNALHRLNNKTNRFFRIETKQNRKKINKLGTV